MRIVTVHTEDLDLINQVANLLVEGFRDTGSTSWLELEAGLREVRESLQEDRISLAALDDNGMLLGWVSGIRQYDGHAWELHGLVVRPEFRSQGIGRTLFQALEDRVRELGATTIFLGTDDENYRTTVSGIDLYPNVLEKLLDIKNPGNHPYEFYQKVGFTIVGIIPDANGFGKPDIFMAKRIAR
jgi:aminoglycoside 6'-N-acetyltransferase I